ncbi:MAG TPA: GDSL-type esterase/lipase family protein [Candidatus Angelobacter sp.]|jgi:lysophospholipase L1-like esterase|nr:GDSL-type esterase/lipase family protein [Candidatus Angelobacter sp.]
MIKTNFTRLFSNSGLNSAHMKSTILVLLFVLVGCGGSMSPAPQPSVPRSGTVFLGDSIFIRWDLSSYFPGKGYINAGIGGQNTSQILARVSDTISGENVCGGDAGIINCQTIAPPKTIVIYAGWNNLFQGTAPQDAISDIRKMASLCRSAGVLPIIVTVYHFDPAFTGGDPFDGRADAIDIGIREVGADLGIPVIDLEQVFSGQSGYTLDGVHPISAGYSQMRDTFNLVLN